MNKRFWEEYYKSLQPTSFAKFCIKYINNPYIKMIDVGCGNGRDTYFFGDNCIDILGIDYAYRPEDRREAKFKKISLKELLKSDEYYDIIYSRFFLHSINNKEIISLIKWSKNYFMGEFRSNKDKPKLFKNHKRNSVKGEWVKDLLIKNGFKIIYYCEKKNLARYKNENPLVVRIIAKKDVSI